MTTFKRYLIHFWGTVTLLFLLALILTFDQSTDIKLALRVYGVIMAIYVFPCAAFFSNYCKSCKLDIYGDVEQICNDINVIVTEKTNRTLTVKRDRELIFSYKEGRYKWITKYNRWLTNDITVLLSDEKITMTIPECFLKHFSSLNTKTSKMQG